MANYPPHNQIAVGNFILSISYQSIMGMGLDVGDGLMGSKRQVKLSTVNGACMWPSDRPHFQLVDLH
jgi:hypothetical protein